MNFFASSERPVFSLFCTVIGVTAMVCQANAARLFDLGFQDQKGNIILLSRPVLTGFNPILNAYWKPAGDSIYILPNVISTGGPSEFIVFFEDERGEVPLRDFAEEYLDMTEEFENQNTMGARFFVQLAFNRLIFYPTNSYYPWYEFRKISDVTLDMIEAAVAQGTAEIYTQPVNRRLLHVFAYPTGNTVSQLPFSPNMPQFDYFGDTADLTNLVKLRPAQETHFVVVDENRYDGSDVQVFVGPAGYLARRKVKSVRIFTKNQTLHYQFSGGALNVSEKNATLGLEGMIFRLREIYSATGFDDPDPGTKSLIKFLNVPGHSDVAQTPKTPMDIVDANDCNEIIL